MTLLGSEHSLLIRSKFRSVLQLRLQQRRTQEQLANQGITPPLKNPTEFHEQRKHLDSDKTEDSLKHKVRNRPDRADVVNMHILQASTAERSIPTAQMKLKRARLADDLNEKIALRPGPLELVEKNILPVDSAVKEAIKGNQVSFSKSADAFAFEEDSSGDGLSPDQTRSEDPQGSAGSPADTKASETPLAGPLGPVQDHSSGSENDRKDSASQPSNQSDTGTQGLGPLGNPIAVHAAVKSKSLSDSKNRHKKPKDPKPKVKKLKYHQYIPPDQKAEKSPPPMDSAYARLLQQQQLFLQLQILSQQQQQHQLGYPGLHQAQLKEPNEQMVRNPNSTSTPLSSTPLSPVKNSFSGQTGVSSLKPGPLPSNLDDLKVSELRQQLRIRGLPVSGTKTALMDRLRPFQDCSGTPLANFGDITTVTFPVTPSSALPGYQSSPSTGALSNGFYHFGSTSSSPPISPASSDLSAAGSLPDPFNDASPSLCLHPSPLPACADESLLSSLNGGSLGPELDGLDSEKDKMLVEKQKVINELTWKLQQEQRHVEELRLQLQKQKRSTCPEKPPPFLAVPVKQEDAASSCPFTPQQRPGKRQGLSSEGRAQACEAAGRRPPGPAPCAEPASGPSDALPSTFLSPQCSPQHSPLGAVKSPQHISLPPSPNNHYFLPSSSGAQGEGHRITSPASNQVCAAQNSGHESHPASFSPQPSGLHPPFSGAQADSSHGAGGTPRPKSPGVQQKMAGLHSSSEKTGPKFSIPSPTFSKSTSAVPEITQPPSYEDAIKQQMTRSQQMDELLDVLIESGEMPANAREDHSCLQKVPKIPGSSRSPPAALPKPSSSAGQLSFDHYGTENDEHLEVLLNSQSPLGKVSDVALLKIGSEEPPFDGIMDGFSGKAAEDLFSAHEILAGPLSPMQTQFSPSSVDSSGLPLSFTESPWETMEWLDLTPPSSTPSFSSLGTSGPSIFNIDFLDVTDLNLNSPMDLHLQQW
ncbi:myocardin isoform X1 [Leptonychotes weddellii]|uniref:Myocardin n=1 Tax=Leptonychotes weddellii TaxID=9713 RepID=A0A7F8R810_LEPWE|nr:myocardin isoform X1 [Leptonychotes weddellii]